jgi:cytochrome c
MHFIRFAAASVLAGFLAPCAFADTSAGLKLAQDNKCLACHQVDSRRVGPPFKAVAQRFAGQEGAASYLAGVIRNGSRGQWGAIPMPAQTHVDPAQATALAQWILSLARQP